MKTYPELRTIATKVVMNLQALHPDVENLVILWPKEGSINFPIAITGQVEASRDVPRMLRELADKLEASKGKLVV